MFAEILRSAKICPDPVTGLSQLGQPYGVGCDIIIPIVQVIHQSGRMKAVRHQGWVPDPQHQYHVGMCQGGTSSLPPPPPPPPHIPSPDFTEPLGGAQQSVFQQVILTYVKV